MTHKRICVALIALIASTLYAQGQTPPPPPVQFLNFATAQKIANAAMEAAKKANGPGAIAIVDADGDLVLQIRLDGTTPRGVTSSQGKARAALLFGMPTSQVQQAMAAGKPVTATLIPPLIGANELTIQSGGLPIIRGGKVIGAIGVGGAAAQQDEHVAQAGLDAAGD